MLKQLRIQNIILIETAEINFQVGFNVLSGETGAGKSAILEALGLIAGGRADTSSVRRGAEKGVIEARFDTASVPELLTLLSEAGIDHNHGEDLLIRRELHASGKSRAFLNHQMAQISLLRKVGDLLLHMSGQHANQTLFSTEHHRRLVDLYGDYVEEVGCFTASWEKEQALRQQIEMMINSERERLLEIETLRMQLGELEEANLKEGEEEGLFHEYTLLTNVEEMLQKTQSIVLAMQESGMLSALFKHRHTFEELAKLDPKLAETATTFHNAVMELEDAAYTLQNYASHLEHNPKKAAQIDERLGLITKLKRKYGNTIAEMLAYKDKAQARLDSLETAEGQLETLKQELEVISKVNNTLASILTCKRTEAAQKLEKGVTDQLISLNMPKAEFQIKISPQKRSRYGDDSIEFYLIPNVGEHLISVKDCASGGELSRILLALQTLLAGKDNMPTMVFDEIDANIGGATANVVGKKLKEISCKHQVLCITHFAQVAKHADHHFEISKKEKEGRTYTLVKLLDHELKCSELARMQGNTYTKEL